MTDRSRYILDFYSQFLTTEERQALRFAEVLLPRRIEPEFTPELEARLRETWLRDGPDRCHDAIAARVERDHVGEMHFHTCPQCGGLCRTPKARQCFRCHYDWH